jgi:ferredoxin-like protein FixX
VSASSTAANALVVQRTCSSANNQKWQRLPTTAGNQWRNVNSNLCMAVQNASTAQAAKLVQVACNAAAPSQVFAWVGQNLVVQHTKQCVDIFGAQTADGAQAIQYGCHAGNNQKFTAR